MRNARSERRKKISAPTIPFDRDAAAEVAQQELLTWYDRHHRDLPWRRSHDPYRVLLSEIMLQQTRVEVVVSHYERFVERFPSLGSLARASEEEVLAAWSGLGYYRRARNLHRAAREIDRRGSWPRTARELARLPGLGPYTSAAVSSIAFGEVAPVVDGNVERVVGRLLALDEDPRRKVGREQILRVARELLDVQRPGDSNQAMMELGATVCRPRSPRCHGCPLASPCAARASGNPTAYPPPRRRSARRRERHRVVVVVEYEDDVERVLLVRRDGDDSQLAGMWELPWIDAEASDPAAVLSGRYGGHWQVDPPLARVRHAITVRDIELMVCRGRVLWSGIAESQEAGFFDAEARALLPMSSMVGKVLDALARAAPSLQTLLPLRRRSDPL